MMSSLKPSLSARRIVWAVWQLLQTGSGLSVFVTFEEWTLASNFSSMP